MTAETLTLTAAATAARALGYTIRRTVDSEVVAYRKGEGVNSPAAYFTNDPADALATVQEMHRRDMLAADAAARARACREEVAAIRQGIETRKRAPQRPEEGRRVIDMTPTWAGLAPALFMALTNGTPEGQRIAREELTRALAALDAHNAAARGKVTLSLELQDAAALARILDFAGPRFHDLTPEQWQGLSDARETLAAALAQPATA